MKGINLLFAASISFGFAAPVFPETFCTAPCPAAAGCVGSCTIEVDPGSSCSADCTAGCELMRCQTFGGPECTDVVEGPCEQPSQTGADYRQAASPLATSWAILEVDDATGEQSPAARGVLVSSSSEAAREAWAAHWRHENRRDDNDNASESRTVFWVAPAGSENIEPLFQLKKPQAKNKLPPASRFYFRAATNARGRVVAVEKLYTSAEDANKEFIRFIKKQYRVASKSVPGTPIFFYGGITVDSGGHLIRSTIATTRLSAADLELFRRQAD